eukprot:TRINITY_DN66742_c4_g4_i1.p1 TRINITY_DN66742_c4_g4~~TRINITY_DN66742_c4_g4_i1.p1  ORF type:complete len:262 (+),score=18.03 TRINITY_DN66742_c4_g4_i1:34-819(+)
MEQKYGKGSLVSGSFGVNTASKTFEDQVGESLGGRGRLIIASWDNMAELLYATVGETDHPIFDKYCSGETISVPFLQKLLAFQPEKIPKELVEAELVRDQEKWTKKRTEIPPTDFGGVANDILRNWHSLQLASMFHDIIGDKKDTPREKFDFNAVVPIENNTITIVEVKATLNMKHLGDAVAQIAAQEKLLTAIFNSNTVPNVRRCLYWNEMAEDFAPLAQKRAQQKNIELVFMPCAALDQYRKGFAHATSAQKQANLGTL